MKRRQFFGVLAASAIGCAAPAWVRRAFAGTPTETHIDALEAAWIAAQAQARPLLIFWVPDAVAPFDERERTLGALLNNADEATMAALALCEVVCANAAAIEAVLPGVPSAQTWMLLVDHFDGQWAARSISPALPALPAIDSMAAMEQDAAYDQPMLERVELLAAALRVAVLDPDAIKGRAEAARSVLDPRLVTRIDHAQPGGALAADDLWGGASLLALQLDVWRVEFATQARARLRTKPPAGARWLIETGCGGAVVDDGSPILAMPCGMGHVPETARRFLSFYTQKSP